MEARDAKLGFGGVQDVRLILDAAEAGRSLHPLHLTATASTLEAAAQLQAAVSGSDRRVPRCLQRTKALCAAVSMVQTLQG